MGSGTEFCSSVARKMTLAFSTPYEAVPPTLHVSVPCECRLGHTQREPIPVADRCTRSPCVYHERN